MKEEIIWSNHNSVESFNKIDQTDYEIIKESKVIKFEDTNVIEDETKYLINFKKEFDLNKQYLLVTPFSYFRIPEKDRMTIKPELMEINSKTLFEKILWYNIFEIILKNEDSENDWSDIRDDLNRKIGLCLKKKRRRSIKESTLSENVKNKIKSVNMKNYIEEKQNINTILDYPNYKIKERVSTKSNFITFMIIAFIVFSTIHIISSFFYSFLNFSIIWFLSLVLLIIILIITYFIDFKSTLTKKSKIRKKYKEILNKFIAIPNRISKKDKNRILKYINSYIEDLYQRLYYATYNDLYETIKDYKTFNPFSIIVKFDGEEIIPEEVYVDNFFKNIIIIIDLSKNPTFTKHEISIQTKRTIRIIRKSDRITREKITVNKLTLFCLIILFLIPWFIIVEILMIEIKLLLLSLAVITLTLLIFNVSKYEYKYYSALQEQRKEIVQKSRFPFYLFKKQRKIYSIPTNLRRNCSYDWLIHAPRFHNIRICKEIKTIIKGLERPIVLRLPHELSRNILSFHIPKSKMIKEVNFQIDLEIPFTGRIVGWLIGMNTMLLNMFILSLLYIFFIFTPIMTFDLTNIRIVLPFLTLLIGFFGKNILESPTRDLLKWGAALIILTVLIGVVLFISSLFDIFI